MSIIVVAAALSLASLLFATLASASRDLDRMHASSKDTAEALDKMLRIYCEIDLDLMLVEIDARRLAEV